MTSINILNGKSIDKEQEVFNCKNCKDTGWIYYSGCDGTEYVKECDCSIKLKAKNRLVKTGVFNAITDKTFGTFKIKNETQKKMKDSAIRYVELVKAGAKQSLMITGKPGTGKTHITFAIINELVKNGKDAYYMPYRDTITKLKQNITNEQEYHKEMKKLKEAEYLVIDDFLKGNITQSDVNIMYEIVNHRYLNNMPIILCTEKNEKEILAFDEATGSRLIEMAAMKLDTKGIDNHRLEV